MADSNGVILQLYSRARAPNRDYYGLTISHVDVILNIWNITHGPHVFPKKQRCELADLQIAKTLVSEIHRLFGPHVADYCLALGRGDARLECLPSRLFMKVLRYLAANDILHLSETSKIFFELCNRNDIWGLIFVKRNRGKPNRDELKAAEQRGWKSVLKNKVAWAEKTTRSKKPKEAVSKPSAVLSNKPVATVSSPVVNISVQKIAKPAGDTKKPLQPQSKVGNVATKPIPIASKASKDSGKTTSLTTLPPKGILKKSNAPATSNTTSQLLESFEGRANLVTTLNFSPVTQDDLDSMRMATVEQTARLNTMLNSLSVSKNQAAMRKANLKERHLDRFLEGLEEKTVTNPYKLDANFMELSAPSTNTLTKPKSSQLRKPKIVDYLDGISDETSVNPEKMTSKFEDYLSSLKEKPRTELRKGDLLKRKLMPQMNELTSSINQIRNSLYSKDQLKMKVPNLSNTKVANKSSISRPLTNKLSGNLPKSTTNLEMKRNVLRSQTKSATCTVKPNSTKANSASAVKQSVNTKSASKITIKNNTNINVKI